MPTDGFEIVDAHLHAWFNEPMGALLKPGGSFTFNEKVFTETLAQMDALGIGQGVLSGPNNVTLEWCKRAPGRFVASWHVDNLPDPAQEADRFVDGIENHGFRALGELLTAVAGISISDKRFYPLYRICQDRQLPVIIHTGLDGRDSYRWAPGFRIDLANPLLLEDVAAAFPDLRIVICHMSYPFTEQATYMLYAHSNVYMDVATVDWIIGRAGFHRLLKQVIDVVGPDKILFGTDQMMMANKIPIGVSAIQEADFLSTEDKRKILGDNARRLFGIA
jgi:uncharacterized protein